MASNEQQGLRIGGTKQRQGGFVPIVAANLHANDASNAIADINGWDEIRRSMDIYKVKEYIDSQPNSVFINDANALYYDLREKMLVHMKANPSQFTKDDVQQMLDLNIFSYYELIDEGLITERSFDNLINFDISALPGFSFRENANITAIEGCTDIYLFGLSGTGKTCLLMGLAGANGATDEQGQIYTLNMRVKGGPYAAALQQYALAGHTIGFTYDKYVTTINGVVTEHDCYGRVLAHNINLVEMSGAELARRIDKEVSFAHMVTGAANLMCNANRKVFFIIIDPSQEMLKFEFVEDVRDDGGNLIEERIRFRYINQLEILNRFVGLFALPVNHEIMSRVDAIHFIVTKADLLGGPHERLEKASQLLKTKYSGPITTLQNYCTQTKRINSSTDYQPKVFTFSLGKFYLGNVFDFDKTESIGIVNVIRNITGSKRERTWWDSLVDFFN